MKVMVRVLRRRSLARLTGVICVLFGGAAFGQAPVLSLPDGFTVGPPTALEAGAAISHGYSGLLQVIPPIEWSTPEAIEDAWLRVKRLPSSVAQVKAVAAEGLYQKACRGLVDLRALSARRGGGFALAFRDDHRGRSWLQPHVLSIVEAAIDTFGRTHRGRTSPDKPVIMVGDAAQPGCGQLEYGAIVEVVSDTRTSLAATELLNSAKLVDGVATVVARLPGADAKTTNTFSETRLVGHSFDVDSRLTLRTVTRRYRKVRSPDPRSSDRLVQTADELMRSPVASQKRVASWSTPRRSLRRRWVTHYLGKHRQMVAVTKSVLDPATPLVDQLDAVLELRVSRLVTRKPLSFKDEVRWTKVGATAGAPSWKRWGLVHEAGHQSHIAGRDLDMGYVTEENHFGFTRSPDKVDISSTWRWFESLDRSARRRGTPLERIIVGPRMHRLLKKDLDLAALDSYLFKSVVKVATGHDGHHHVRVAPIATLDAPIADRLMRPWSIIYSELFER